MLNFVKQINANILWGWPTILLLLFTGIGFSFLLGFVQVRRMGYAVKETFSFLAKKEGKTKEKSKINSFQSLAAAVAAQVGTGNLAGVATAIVSGGPGAVFWMWISGFFGMATIYAEAVISQYYVEEKDGKKVGGPAYYISKGLKNKRVGKFLAHFFAVALVCASFFIGNMVQSNSIASSAHTAFGLPRLLVGITVSILIALIFIGGVDRMIAVTEKMVPIMALLYIIGSLIIILTHAEKIGPVFTMIFKSAFTSQALLGGAMGTSVKMAFRYGIARGLFSNEAGTGSTPHAHALAEVEHPSQQGLVATLGVLIDTGIICTMTALVILTTGAFGVTEKINGVETFMTGPRLTQEAFYRGFGNFGIQFISISLFFFAFSTLIGWYFFGETNVDYLFGKKGILPYRIMVIACIILGAVLNVELVWELADVHPTT